MALAERNQQDDCFICGFLKGLIPSSDGTHHRAPFEDTNKESFGGGGGGITKTTYPTTSSANSSSYQNDDYYEPTNMDFANADFRGFVFAIHPDHGYTLLHCTRKKNKPHHFQLPGGHIDASDFSAAAAHNNGNNNGNNDPPASWERLLLATKIGTCRELYEETGIDLRNSLHRLEPCRLYEKNRKDKLCNEYKSRLFFTVHLTDDDFLREDNMSVSEAAFLQKAMGAQPPPNLKLKLSNEHQGFTFERDSEVASTLLQHHTGGKASTALRMLTAIQAKQKR